ncbi:MAG: NADP-dependent malic enzyme [Archangium sp.]|nr:NADP-dependent malic enzyme [Archangium sp.]MDP3569674.1 NADP-dependent malic enzyme [Archangium sp.]
MATSFTPMSKKVRREDALEYHSQGRPGKIEVVPTKPTATARDLALAYTPGVAEPCLEIEKNPDLSYTYTTRGNLVGVVTNGTAVLGLGDIGPYAAKPVMEGKGVLFKKFADIDVFDINVDAKEIDAFCAVVKALEPTFGGINLEDIKAPECFVIEKRLQEQMNIPVFHDDQHGTAIISGAAMLNACELAGKKMDQVRVVVSGAGAAAIACINFWIRLGVKLEHVLMVDTKGVLHTGRTDAMNEWKKPFVRDTSARTLADALINADVFLGASVKGLVTGKMLEPMAKKPIIFALANPDPEIDYHDAKAARPDAIVATGRSDFPNQVNNVLGFPFIFRGALDVRARRINEDMKLAAAHALALLAREDVPDAVSHAYGGERFHYGPDYIIPKPFDSRVLLWVAPAVAKAAMDTGVARLQVELGPYRERLQRMQSRSHQVMSSVFERAKSKPQKIAFNDGEHPRVLQAARILKEEGLCEPVLMGNAQRITQAIVETRLEDELKGITIIDPTKHANYERYAKEYLSLEQRHGVSSEQALVNMARRNYFGSMLVKDGAADGFVTGLTQTYPEAVRPLLEVIGTREGRRAGGVYIMVQRNEFKFFADCTMNPVPTPEYLADIAIATADLARSFDVTPRIAFLSYSNFGSAAGGPSPARMRAAMELAHARRPELEMDGEMQVDTALVEEERRSRAPFCRLTGDANVLIFPSLDAANTAYKVLWRFGGAEVIGPILLGMKLPVNVLQNNASVQDIVNLGAVTAVRAQGGEFLF